MLEIRNESGNPIPVETNYIVSSKGIEFFGNDDESDELNGTLIPYSAMKNIINKKSIVGQYLK